MVRDYLQPEEQALAQTGRHPLSIMDEIIGGTLFAGAVIAFIIGTWFSQDIPNWNTAGVPIVVAVGAGYLMFLVTRAWRITTSRYIVTDARVYKSYGRIRFNLYQTTYDKVTDMHVRQSLFGRIWGFGTIRVETAGTGIALEGVRNPFEFKRQIEASRHAFLGVLIREFSTRSTTGARKLKPAVESSELWTGGPTAASFVGSIIGLSPILIAGGAFLILGIFLESRFLLGALAVAVVIALVLLNLWIRFRFTRFHIETRGVVVTSGWLSRRRVETTFDKVTDVTVFQGVLARMLNYGSITINTAGSNQAPVVFHGLGAPRDIKEMIDKARRDGS